VNEKDHALNAFVGARRQAGVGEQC
jgi:hypothetical protein